MSDTPERLTVRCPGCQARLVVDTATGEVLSHHVAERPAAGGKDFDALLQGLDEAKAEAEAVFERELGALEDRDRLLEEKFGEALKRAQEEPDDEPPPRPWDLD